MLQKKNSLHSKLITFDNIKETVNIQNSISQSGWQVFGRNIMCFEYKK